MELDPMWRPFSRTGSWCKACPSLLCFTPEALLPSALISQLSGPIHTTVGEERGWDVEHEYLLSIMSEQPVFGAAYTAALNSQLPNHLQTL